MIDKIKAENDIIREIIEIVIDFEDVYSASFDLV